MLYAEFPRLANQGYVVAGTVCFDLAEKALKTLVKGSLVESAHWRLLLARSGRGNAGNFCGCGLPNRRHASL
jgi:hypothetical protein